MAGIVPILFIGGIAALIAALMSKKSSAATATVTEKEKKEVDDKLEKVGATKLVQAAEVQKKPVLLVAAAVKAQKAGEPKLAEALKKRADGMKVETQTVTYKPPTPTITPEAWTKFVNCSMSGTAQTVTPGFSMGLFGFGARRLVDLGVMRDPYQDTFKGKKVWTAKWVAPWDLKKFLADSAYQYQMFQKSMTAYANQMVKDGMKFPMTIDGKPLTMSGALGIAHKAGYSGMRKWISTPSDRKKFAATTATLLKCNGLF